MRGEYLEVRCCCQPRKLLGWLPVPRCVESGPGTVVTFTIREEHLEVDDRLWRHPASVHLVHLPIAAVADGDRQWLAFKSEETPLEQLRRIPGFVESFAP